MPPSPSSDVRVVVGTIELSKWVRYEIESDMLSPSDAFSLVVANPGGESTSSISVYDEVKVVVDGTVQMTGYVDEVNRSIQAGQPPTLEISGRDRFGQLVDNSATPKHYNRVNLLEFAKQISAPWVTEWIVDNEDNRAKLIKARSDVAVLGRQVAQFEQRNELENYRAKKAQSKFERAQQNLARLRDAVTPRVKVEPGQSIFDVLSEIAEHVGLHLWQAADGRGILGRPNYKQDPLYSFSVVPPTDPEHANNNVLSARIAETGQERYATYRLLTNTANTVTDYGTASRSEVDTEDSNVSIPRVLIQAGDRQTRSFARTAIERDRDRRRFEALTIQLEVRNHGQGNALYQADTLCRYKDAINGLDDTFYVTGRRFIGDADGQRTELTLRRKDLYLS